MRLTTLLVLVLSTSALAAPEKAKAPAPEKAPASAPAPKNAAFERLKSLAGTWTGKTLDKGGKKTGAETTVIYKVTAAESAVMETLAPGTPHEMVTMYTLDGDQLMLTHYCAAGNQPRMKLEDSKDPDVLSFRFSGGTNMKESDMHMHAAQITFVDADNIKGVWSSMKDGKPAGDVRFELTRKK